MDELPDVNEPPTGLLFELVELLLSEAALLDVKVPPTELLPELLELLLELDEVVMAPKVVLGVVPDVVEEDVEVRVELVEVEVVVTDDEVIPMQEQTLLYRCQPEQAEA